MAPIKTICARLKAKYPVAHFALCFVNPLELLVSTILSAQCTDARVNIVTKALFKKYRRPEDYARANLKTLEHEIRSTGFYRNKAKNIMGAAKIIVRDFGGRVPDTMVGLLRLPGVARKTANVVLYSAFGKNEGIAVDTHVRRLSQRLGLTKNTDPVKIESDLLAQLPKKEWGVFSLRLVWHGRATCMAKKPNCPACVLGGVCPSKQAP
ncbi:MAG: endonuclease III [Candidatus Omnitrophota bacterium]